ncbi:pyridoxal-phosphate dependent enzyme [Streptomyces sp. NBC_00144]|uniref:1-aminocyclopropane-1-carboxylate deaminase/D-cysteine desulfhydrase n=1 Tax=unclassified Streptomyces TaxID=2593676 RepID=UPI003246A278|nr:pyridoxal-phosphate dependent enzyme [Streptomyces sp. NBC_00932]
MPPGDPGHDRLRPLLPSPLEPLDDERFARHGVQLLLKRDDLIHPDLPGNKWRKLAPNLTAAAGRTVLTFGGAYSNHLRATAAAGRLLGFPTVGVVRGDELAHRPLNPSLAQCAADGMRLHFVDRTAYRAKAVPAGLDTTGMYVIPEGGSNTAAVHGCGALGRELHGLADTVAVAVGTGGTLAGLAAGLTADQRAIGFPVLKGGFLPTEVATLQQAAFGARTGDWRLDDRFHFGGYARTPPELEAFATGFEERHGVPVERVYVAKMLYGLTELAADGAFPPGTRVAAVITGQPVSSSR